jgi:aryl-alcohol dehydrogenase-like predicted oxidoreductase
MKIGLGTVQFGLPYGVSNTTGRTEADEVGRILEYAESSGICVLDTAAAYGDSEKVLGRFISGNSAFRVVTKTLPIKGDIVDSEAVASVEQRFETSLKNLGQASIYGLLLHRADDLLKPGGGELASWLAAQKVSGKVSKVGVSVYERRTLDAILDKHAIDVVQLPLNILDQRLLANGYLAELKAAGIEIHVRSAFLQGLLLMHPDEMPPYFSGIQAHMRCLKQFIEDQGLSSIEAALGFVSSIDEVDSVVCGVNTIEQLKEIVACATTSVDAAAYKEFAISDEKVLDPSQWQLA